MVVAFNRYIIFYLVGGSRITFIAVVVTWFVRKGVVTHARNKLYTVSGNEFKGDVAVITRVRRRV